MSYRDEWQAYPMNCATFAALAGDAYNCREIAPSGNIRFCVKHAVFDGENPARMSSGGHFVLVTHGSDAWTKPGEAERLPDNVVRWFSNHVTAEHPKLECVPVGLVYSADMFNQLRDQALKGRPARRGLLYMSFTREHPNYAVPREPIWQRLCQPWVTRTEIGRAHV